ncbi:MAG: LLM class flavin-dependent oxidoreductase, partial [Nitrospinae bacterium]|nr:LLM class flavin-dependent oxidoreductase [Nitrospinota bacterium]
SDWALFNVDGQSGQHREMTREALDIILKLWQNEGPLQYTGKFWSVNVPDTMYGTLRFHITPFQKPYPPIGVASVSIRSPTLVIAGERGFLPMSLGLNAAYLASHWEAVEEGAKRTGLTPSRKDWRIVRDVYVADTDGEAQDAALNGMIGRVWREYLLPLFDAFQLLSVFKHDPNVPDGDVTPEYLMDHLWLVGSPETVTEKLYQLDAAAGGFGTLLVLVYDHRESQAGWEKSTRLLAQKVMPNVADLSPP